ncbi:MAG: polysaccharide biosynthesis tyrosine autokinase [Bacteroidota bacterium]
MSENKQQDFIQINFQRWLSKLLSWWWLFLIFPAIALVGGHLYLRYTTYEYATKATVLFKDAGRSGVLSEEGILLGQGLTGGRKAMDNEMQILRSLPIMEQVVEKLNLNVSYHRQGKFKEEEYYKNAPIKVDTFALVNGGNYGVSFFVQTLDKNRFILKMNEEEEGEIHYYNIGFNNEYGYLKLSANDGDFFIPGTYRVSIAPTDNVAQRYVSKLRIEKTGDVQASSILDLKMQSPTPHKAEDIINTLITLYNEAEINDENTVLRNTLDFIDGRIAILSKELDLIESDLERFKSRNTITAESAAASRGFVMTELRAALQRLSDFEVQKNILSSLETFLTQERAIFELIPGNLTAETPVLSTLIERHNNMILERNRLMTFATEENPTRKQLEKELLDNRSLIVESIQNLRKDLEIPIRQLEQEVKELEGSMTSVPSIERDLIEQTRMQKIKENLFLLLLQKREETALSEAVAAASTRIVDSARSTRSPVYPKKKLIYIASFLIGLFVPFAFINIKELLNTKIDSEDDIKLLTQIPIYGRIAQNKGKERIVVKAGRRSAVNEMFRELRTNLNYLNNDAGSDKKIFAVTSSVPGEGKTFVAINLAITLALSGKKVAIVELDLRKPRFQSYIGLEDNNVGATNYLIGDKRLEEIKRTFAENENLTIITSGPIPPNPSELILSERMNALVEELKNEYDYVIFDNPPIGLVSDALLLRSFIDQLLIITRHRYTKKFMVKNLEEMRKNKELPKAGIVINGIKQRGSYYGYGNYRYGGYGKGYYQ